MEALGTDLQLRILRLLPLPDRVRALCISRTFAALGRPGGPLWSSLELSGGARGLSSSALLARLCARAGAALSSLDVSNPAVVGALTVGEVLAALQAAPSLSALRAWRPPGSGGAAADAATSGAWPGGPFLEFPPQAALALVAACPLLRHVSIRVETELGGAAALCAAVPFHEACFVCSAVEPALLSAATGTAAAAAGGGGAEATAHASQQQHHGLHGRGSDPPAPAPPPPPLPAAFEWVARERSLRELRLIGSAGAAGGVVPRRLSDALAAAVAANASLRALVVCRVGLEGTWMRFLATALSPRPALDGDGGGLSHVSLQGAAQTPWSHHNLQAFQVPLGAAAAAVAAATGGPAAAHVLETERDDQSLGEVLRASAALRSLHLERCATRGVRALAQLPPGLWDLRLRSCDVRPQAVNLAAAGVSAIYPLPAAAPPADPGYEGQLFTLDFSGNVNLTWAQLERLLSALLAPAPPAASASTATAADAAASAADFGGGGGFAWEQAFRRPELALPLRVPLRRLALAGCSLGERGALALGLVLRAGSRMEELDVSGNGLGDRGFASLGEGAARNPWLRRLNAGDNELTDEGAEDFAEALAAAATAAAAAASRAGGRRAGGVAQLGGGASPAASAPAPPVCSGLRELAVISGNDIGVRGRAALAGLQGVQLVLAI